MNPIRSVGVYLMLILLVSSCGYNLVGRGSFLPKDIETITIPLFQNATSEPNIEIEVTNQLRQRFITDGRLKVVEKAGQIRLDGKIMSYNLLPVAYDEKNNVSEYWVQMDFLVVLHDRVRNEELINQSFSTKWHYKVSSAITDSESQRRDAIREASIDSAGTIVSLVIEGF
jgi:hypothetical protein